MFKPNITIRIGAAHHDIVQRFGPGDPRAPYRIDLSQGRKADIAAHSRTIVRWLASKGYFA